MMAGNSLSELDALFRSPDAIMRPDIKDLIARYSALGGTLRNVPQELVRHYRGYPVLIDILARELGKFGVDATAQIQRQVHDSLKGVFKIDEMDRMLVEQGGPPKWLALMLRSPQWIPAILGLARTYPRSFFIGYCLNRIAMDFPDAVTRLPAGLVTYQAYAHVLKFRLQRLELNRGSLSEIMNVIGTDDLTITHAAFVCHRMADPDLAIHIDNQLQDQAVFRSLFNHIILRLDNCDDDMIDLLTTKKGLTSSAIEAVERKCSGSPFVRYLIGKKIKDALFQGNLQDDVLTPAIRCLSSLGRRARLRPDDLEYITEAVKLLQKPQRLSEPPGLKLAIIMRALEIPFFVDVALPYLLALIKRDELTEYARLRRSVEALMLCQVASLHQSSWGTITDSLFQDLPQRQSVSEIYGILQFLSSIGFALEIIQRMSAAFPPGRNEQVSERRLFVLYFLKNAYPPYTPAFITAFTRWLSQENFRSLVIVDRTTSFVSRQNASHVVDFVDRVDASGVRGLSPEVQAQLQELRAAAQRIIA
jgi:hypothetical protein